MWRFRVGALRIVYRFDDERIEVSWIGRRATVYDEIAARLRGE